MSVPSFPAVCFALRETTDTLHHALLSTWCLCCVHVLLCLHPLFILDQLQCWSLLLLNTCSSSLLHVRVETAYQEESLVVFCRSDLALACQLFEILLRVSRLPCRIGKGSVNGAGSATGNGRRRLWHNPFRIRKGRFFPICRR